MPSPDKYAHLATVELKRVNFAHKLAKKINFAYKFKKKRIGIDLIPKHFGLLPIVNYLFGENQII